jgi:hypothetical protein
LRGAPRLNQQAMLCSKQSGRPCRRQQHPAELQGAPEAVAPQPRRRVIEDENTIVVKGITYTKLECVGRGGSSKVGREEGGL